MTLQNFKRQLLSDIYILELHIKSSSGELLLQRQKTLQNRKTLLDQVEKHLASLAPGEEVEVLTEMGIQYTYRVKYKIPREIDMHIEKN